MWCLKTILFLVLLDVVWGNDNRFFVYQVLVLATDGNVKDHCGGAVIHSQWIMSSFICTQRLLKKFNAVTVIAGFSESRRKYDQTRKAVRCVGHDDRSFDVGLVQVDQPFFLSSRHLQVAKLPSKTDRVCRLPMAVSVYPAKTNSTDVFNFNLKRLGKVVLTHGQKRTTFDLLGAVRTIQVEEEWHRKARSNSMYVGSVKKGPVEICSKNKGWPLFCGDKIFGIEASCLPSDARAQEAGAKFVGIDSEADMLAKAFELSVEVGKSQGRIAWNFGGASHAHDTSWTRVFLILALSICTFHN